jgi:hypothetical protein
MPIVGRSALPNNRLQLRARLLRARFARAIPFDCNCTLNDGKAETMNGESR